MSVVISDVTSLGNEPAELLPLDRLSLTLKDSTPKPSKRTTPMVLPLSLLVANGSPAGSLNPPARSLGDSFKIELTFGQFMLVFVKAGVIIPCRPGVIYRFLQRDVVRRRVTQ